MIIKEPHFMTKIDVWWPKYSTKWGDFDEPVALLHKAKTDFASPVIIVNFSKAKDLANQRFAIRKKYAQEHEVGDNGRAKMYVIPMSHFESWESTAEVRETALNLWED